MQPSLAEAVHLASSDTGAGALIGAGVKRSLIRPWPDRFTSGPCDVDPARQKALRDAWLDDRGTPAFWPRWGLPELRAAISDEAPIVLWGTRAFPDLVWLWWALDSLGRIGVEQERLFWARPEPDHPLETLGGCLPEVARAALVTARLVTEDEWHEGAELWIEYASPSPLAFDEARRRGSRAFPELTSSADLHGAWFPRVMGGRLRLSELDTILLGCVTESWGTTMDFLQQLPPEQYEPLLLPFDA